MFPVHNRSTLKKTRFRRQNPKLRQRHSIQSTKKEHRTPKTSSLVNRFYEIISNLKKPGSRFSSYTITELEPICQQIAIQEMASTTTTVEIYCPLVCTFCQDLIYEPITLYCGHTFCYQCIQDEQFSTDRNCPRCPDDVQEQIQSSIVHARERDYKKNCFLKQLFDRSETLKPKCETILSCHQGRKEYKNGNYQQAIDIYSKIIDQYDDDHLALYHRAEAYTALKQYDEGLNDATRVVTLKPQWAKGYLCQSEILFALEHFETALMTSLKALAIDPEDQLGKQIMARHLHTVLHDNDDKEVGATMKSETEQVNSTPSSSNSITETVTSATDNSALTMCKLTQSSNSCYCLQFDYKNLHLKDFECAICVALLWFPVTTPCGHVFCRECLIRSVDNTQALCPVCKHSLEEFFPLLIKSYVNKTEIISKILETYFPNEYNERRQLFEQEIAQGASISRSLINNTEAVILEIPIFVCVLTFPNCICPLHVFEPRYRLMMRRTIETESRTFGMCSYDESTDTFADYGTLLYIRGLVYTLDGRSIVDTIGKRRFRVIERGSRDGYNTAKVELIRDHLIEQHEFDDLFQLNRDTYQRVHDWFDQLDAHTKTLMAPQLEEYPPCDDLTQESTDGPRWTWIMLNLLPIEHLLLYTALASQSYRIRLQMINDAIDFSNNQQPTTASSNDEQ